ncbi:hypothetical protein NHH03_18025 [Stieleria sp. TO1_6]|uniref:PulJ/GspJ family protein n=1 Tax=Stieleria tagensis TaxID=2956795 RepID=UPI00209A817C|nr:hypothetical protein [Stieleria tagensis]MCO8123649.1 hypothetical protein [Stieleria tagensis]
MNQHNYSKRQTRKLGFTILEVLIALTASLLLMLGLARAYKLLGDKVTERQSEMDLSSRLRDVVIRLRDELRSATCEMNPPAKYSAAEGYLVYHEGPFTDSTTILGGVSNPVPRDTIYFPDSRYGDIDDYLAFTSRAQDSSPFLGFIPQGVLDAVRFMNGRMSGAEQTAYNATVGTQLVPFYSDVAEIAYWVSPEWARNPDGTLVYESQVADGGGNFSRHPVFIDRNDDLLPDKLNLHRRVLLVRPDLNVTPAEMSIANSATVPTPTPATWNIPTVPFLVRTAGGLRVFPLSDVAATSPALFPGNNSLVAPGLWMDMTNAAPQFTAAPHWMTGVARIQQIMDLSLSRVTDSWSVPEVDPTIPATYGMPTAILKANSLADLTRPENRFAHVRIPHQVISGSPGSSMPQIALCPPHPYLIARESSPASLADTTNPLTQVATAPTTFPHQADAVVGSAPGGSPYVNRYGRFTMKTFLRPEFNLADRVTDTGAGGTSASLSVNRGGTDVIATDVVGFNVQIFDSTAPKFIWTGSQNGVPGGVGDDDGDTVIDNETELGWPGSDDEPVSPNSLRLDEVLINNGTRTATVWNQTPVSEFFVVERGDFVDLGYTRLAGGPMRGLFQFDESGGQINTPAARLEDFSSSFSGLNGSSPTVVLQPSGATRNSMFPISWEQSGRMIVRTIGDGRLSSYYQPVYDTWTDSYSTDSFDQEGLGVGSGTPFGYAIEVAGVTTGIGALNETRSTQANPSNTTPGNHSDPRNVVIRRWTSLDGSLGISGEFAGESAGSSQIVPQGSDTPIQITPPVPEKLRAIKISIRLNDFAAETIRQQTVIQEF